MTTDMTISTLKHKLTDKELSYEEKGALRVQLDVAFLRAGLTHNGEAYGEYKEQTGAWSPRAYKVHQVTIDTGSKANDQIDGVYDVTVYFMDWEQRAKRSTSLGYVRGTESSLPEPEVEHFPGLGLTTVHTKRGEFPTVDRAWDKMNRSMMDNQRFVLLRCLCEIELCERIEDKRALKAMFSRNAGCSSCPCSPGFKIAGLPGYYVVNVTKRGV